MKSIGIMTPQGVIDTFEGKYRRDLEKPNWHYYEKSDGTLLHVHKEHMVVVIEQEIKETSE